MIDRNLIELIQRDVDGYITPGEKRRLNAAIAGNEEARTLHEELRGLTLQLSRAGSVEAPRSLKPAIMRQVERASAPAKQPAGHRRFSILTTPSILEVFMKSRLNPLAIGGIGVAIVAIAYFALYYPPPQDDQAQGTIGNVKKYRSEQINDKDVVVGGEQSGTAANGAGNAAATFDRVATLDKSALVSRMTMDERKAFFGRLGDEAKSVLFKGASVQEKNAAYGRMSVEERTKLIGAMPAEAKASILDRISSAEQLAAVAGMSTNEKSALAARLSLNDRAMAFDRYASVAARSAVAAKATVAEKAAGFDAQTAEARATMAAKMIDAEKSKVIGRMDTEAKAQLLDRIGWGSKLSALDRMTDAAKASILDRAVPGSHASLLDKIPVAERMKTFDRMTSEAKASFFSALPTAEKSFLAGRMSDLQQRSALEGKTQELQEKSARSDN
jgi:hypothetical protein